MSLVSVSTITAEGLFAEGAVNVDLDASLVVQIVVFIVLLVVLKPLLFDPMMKLFEEREKRIEGTRLEATKEDKRSAKALAEYERALEKARSAGAQERDTIRADAAKREAELMGTVRAQTASTLEEGRAATAREASAARKQLEVESTQLARAIAGRVLGREVSS
jgi:F-type H+-transporting ATPase subunit b